jgi:hypothetical protein
MAENKDDIVTKEEKVIPDVQVQHESHFHDHDHAKKLIVIGSLAAIIFFIICITGILVSGSFTRTRELANNARQRISYGVRDGRQMMGNHMILGFNNNSIQGNVTAVDGQKLTINVSGTSKTVQISTDTRFPLNSDTKINVGDIVTVTGEQDSSGVIQAQHIIVNPTTK